VLVEPQLGENIGMAARAMGNFGLTELRIVNPRDGWPNSHAQRAASGADGILAGARIFASLGEAVADCTLVFATTARAHDQAKPVVSPEQAAAETASALARGGRIAVLFGRERYGLENAEVALADKVITFPVNPAFASLNLAQSVLLVGYEYFKLATSGALPFAMPEKSMPARKQQLHAFFDNLERELERVEFFRPPEKRETMTINLRNIFARMAPSQQDVQTLQGVIMALAEGRKGPAAGGVLDGAEAGKLRELLAEHGLGRVPSERGPVRGLSRLLRRNPTDAERALWQALVNDRRFAGKGFKRQTPIGGHIVDVVSFALKTVIDLVPADETPALAKARAERGVWLAARDSRVIALPVADLERDQAAALDALAAAIGK
jgi:tRNA/rRNA methyltransferase